MARLKEHRRQSVSRKKKTTRRRISVPVRSTEPSAPKTTRPHARERQEKESRFPARRVATAGNGAKPRVLDALPDRIDIRDWVYQPVLEALPDQIINCDKVPLPILDQGQEGACTGFALAAVINYLLRSRNRLETGGIDGRVSSRMLYEMARRYDEWPGETYEGSSARGAMKGWVAHGVCTQRSWPITLLGHQNFTPEFAEEAIRTPGGAYYRVNHREIRDMHAALHEVGILYVTLMVHDGWNWPGFRGRNERPESQQVVTVSYVDSGNSRTRRFPIIQRVGRADGGHAVAIVGYTDHGFIVQNSWSDSWGAGGFALLPYEDYMLHSTDVWVAQLGVPVRINAWRQGHADSTEGLARAQRVMPLAEIRPYVIDVGNNGELSDSGAYWTTEADLERLFGEQILEQAVPWSAKRVLLYLHGGLNDEAAVARRIVAFRDVLLANEIYPVHVMWESGLGQSLSGMISDLFTDDDDEAARAAGWLSRFRDGLVEAKDRAFELTAALPGGSVWREMKENALMASEHPRKVGAMHMVVKHAQKALARLSAKDRRNWELHVVGHSAGSIFAAHALRHLIALGMDFRSLQFMAPAITTDLFKRKIVPSVVSGECPHPTVYNLSDIGERDDSVGAYAKSLLYLVSNAFEGRREASLLGMERFISDAAEPDPTKRPKTFDQDLNRFFKKKIAGAPSLVIAGKVEGPDNLVRRSSTSRSDSHGGFDNDPDTMNSILRRILRAEPVRPFTVRDLQY